MLENKPFHFSKRKMITMEKTQNDQTERKMRVGEY